MINSYQEFIGKLDIFLELPLPNPHIIKQFKSMGIHLDVTLKLNIYFQFIVAYLVCKKQSISDDSLLFLILKYKSEYWSTDNNNNKYILKGIKFILSTCPLPKLKDDSKAIIINTGNTDLFTLMNYPIEPLSSKLLRKCLFNLYCQTLDKKDQSRTNLEYYIQTFKYEMEKEDFDNYFISKCPFSHNDMYKECEMVLKYKILTLDVFIVWLEECIKDRSQCCKVLIQHGTEHNLWKLFTQDQITYTLIHSLFYSYSSRLNENLEILQLLFTAFEFKSKILWLDCKKQFGISESKRIEKCIEKFEWIDLTEIDTPTQEKWIWLYTVALFFEPKEKYYEYDYNKMPDIHPYDIFKDIKTVNDIIKNVKLIYKELCLIANFHFEFEGEIFYREEQDYILFACEESTVKVYISNADFPYVRNYVAKDLAEFLSRMKIEHRIWDSKKIGSELDEKSEQYSKDFYLKIHNKD